MEDERKRIKERKKKFKISQDEDMRIPVFKESNMYLSYWNNSVLILAIFNSFAVPIEMTVYTQLSSISWYSWLDIFINFLFFIDIITQFNTGFYDSEGQMVRDRKEIAKRYMFRGLFIFDFFSTIPYEALGLNTIKFLKILKITRITRLTKTINKLELKEENKAIVKIFKTILILFLAMHCIGCLWY